METSLFLFMRQVGTCDSFLLRKGMEPLSELNNTWFGVDYLGHRTLLLWKIHQSRMWLTGLRTERGCAASLSGREDFELGLSEPRVEKPLSTKQVTDKGSHFQHIWYSVLAHELCFLALETFCSKPNLAWNPINIKQKKNRGALIELEVWAPLA